MSSECIICALARSDLIPPYVAGVGLGEGTSASMQPARGPFQPGLLTPTRSSAAFAAGRLIPVATLALRVVRDGDGAVLRPGPFVSFCPPYRDGPNTKLWACILLPPSNIGSDGRGRLSPFRFRFFGHLTVWNTGGHVRTESELMYRARSPGGWRTLRIAAGSCLHCCPECVQLRTDRLGCWLVDIPAVTPPATSAPGPSTPKRVLVAFGMLTPWYQPAVPTWRFAHRPVHPHDHQAPPARCRRGDPSTSRTCCTFCRYVLPPPSL